MPIARVRELEMSYTISGPERGDPVLLVHGLGNSSLVWAEAAPVVAAAGFRVVAADCRGHGASGKPAGPYAIEQMADDWAALHAHLSLGPAHWVGSSMGGAIAMTAAVRHPARVRSLALVSTWSGTDPAFAETLAARVAALEGQGIDGYARLAFPQAFGERYRRAHPEAFAAYRARVAQADVAALKATVGALARHDATARLGEVRVPTTVMVGDQDGLLPPRYAEALAAAIVGARLVRFPGVGHLPMVEAPGEFHRALLEHLAAG